MIIEWKYCFTRNFYLFTCLSKLYVAIKIYKNRLSPLAKGVNKMQIFHFRNCFHEKSSNGKMF